MKKQQPLLNEQNMSIRCSTALERRCEPILPEYINVSGEESLVAKIEMALREASHAEKIEHLQKFFQTSTGGYGEGDIFIGLTNPEVRSFVKQYKDIPLDNVTKLLKNAVHEIRLLALLIMVNKYEKGDVSIREAIYKLYLANIRHINNWDLVDLSAPGIVGVHLLNGKRSILKKLAKSNSLWEQRIAVISTLTLIRHGEFKETLSLAEQLLTHPHDLMHKACGWALREIGKRNKAVLSEFLSKYKLKMPRTMLRYAIEHYSIEERKEWLKK